MSNAKWAAIVYGRTHEVDFRFIATPKDFKNDKFEKNWALNHILTTTRSASKLSGNPRWSLFKNECHCVVGVTCMVRELIGRATEETSEDLTKDSKGRPLYVFVGYVARVDKEHAFPPLPPYLGNNLKFFEPLYQYVRDVWFVKNYEEASKVPSFTEYQDLPEGEFSSLTDYDSDFSQSLNYQNRYKVFLWPDSEEYRQKLWMTVPRCKRPISLCLGLAGQKDVIDSPFLNGTAEDVVQQIKINKHSKQPDEWDGVDEALSSETSRQVPMQQQPIRSVDSRQETVRQQHQYHQRQTNEIDSQSPLGWIVEKGKEDLKRTVEDAQKVVAKGQDLLQSISEPVSADQTRDDLAQQKQPRYRDQISQPQQTRKTHNPDRYPKNFTSQQHQTEDFGFKPKQPETESQKSQQNETQQSDSVQNSDSQDWF
ncbi:hypothetical protein PCC9214_05807 [Planktothrix tepida]|uniref:Uncharacterized protein n=1 Tax=Planktothrix tepida PCC 9214 TaxID=671072 RepID=A0A1J1LUZ1_9CYAN|nr:hypothetical protein [Planktothrix tepida]CAD5990481.1 hypothetical protein PCC9214_05807 [Planktothrix tepida]CUR35401.1 hypothetical protein PL9214670027 [Planktothrix tepida PCC 9214]